MITRLIVRILGNSLAIYLCAYFFSGFNFPINNWQLLLLAGLVLALLNGLLKPILGFVSAPLTFLTLGVWPLVINIGILWLLTYLIPELKITSFWAYLESIALITIVNWLINIVARKKSPAKNDENQ
ncbi:MAG: phage holin family protein [Candidatus Portnoybacteria bacterium]|nr:phage holin family protein [Candidatus Portnoybacteria bacterium]